MHVLFPIQSYPLISMDETCARLGSGRWHRRFAHAGRNTVERRRWARWKQHEMLVDSKCCMRFYMSLICVFYGDFEYVVFTQGWCYTSPVAGILPNWGGSENRYNIDVYILVFNIIHWALLIRHRWCYSTSLWGNTQHIEIANISQWHKGRFHHFAASDVWLFGTEMGVFGSRNFSGWHLTQLQLGHPAN